MRIEPVMGSLPRYAWRNQVATINNAARTGEKFATLPGGYSPKPGGVPRGGNVPGVVAGEGRDAQILAGGAKSYNAMLPTLDQTTGGLTVDPGTSQDSWRLRAAQRAGLYGPLPRTRMM